MDNHEKDLGAEQKPKKLKVKIKNSAKPVVESTETTASKEQQPELKKDSKAFQPKTHSDKPRFSDNGQKERDPNFERSDRNNDANRSSGYNKSSNGESKPFNRTSGQRPAGNGYQGQRPTGGGYQGQRPAGDGYQGQRPAGGGYQGQRPAGGGYQGQRPAGNGYQGQRPAGGGYQGQRPAGGGYQGQRPAGGGYQGQRPAGSGYQGQRPTGGGYQGQRPAGGGYQGQRPGGNASGNFRNNNNSTGAVSSSTAGKTESHRRQVTHKDKKVFERNNKRIQEEIALSKLQAPMKKKKGEAVIPEEIEIGTIIKLSDLAHKMNLKAAELISSLFKLGQSATINDDLDSDTATLLADEFKCRVIVKDEHEEVQIKVEEDKVEELQARPPIVTIMGHVDHGKTRLLDTIRKTNVVAHESGGITQHIGAYSVKVPSGDIISFLDTPGHAAFTSMRARGAKVTDIVILVVSAEEGPKPQTLEALSHARVANVPIIVAINKMDLPNANPEKIKQLLAEHGLLPEEWGGDTQFVPVSAITGDGIPALLEAVLLQAEVMELKANPNRLGNGFVIESKMDIGRGAIATVMIKNGTAKVGDSYIAGTTFGRIRAMFDDIGRKVTEAGPSIPVEIMGFDSLPEAGDDFHIMENEEEARSLANRRAVLKRNENIVRQKKATMSNAMEKIQNPNLKEYKVVVKADVNGSLEAILYALSKLKNTEVKVTVVHSGIGAVSENDVMLAQTLVDSDASDASILAFRVRVDSLAKNKAESVDIPIRRYNVIYDLVEHVHSIIEGMLDPEVSETKIGEAEIKEIFKITNVGKVAGSIVKEGFLRKNLTVRLYREGTQVWSGNFKSLRRFKDEVNEVQQGFDCGVTFINYDDFKVGDIIEVYEVEQTSRKLEIEDNSHN